MVDHAASRWIGSNGRLGLGDHLVRPADIPCPNHPAFIDVTVQATERMHVALNLLDQQKPIEARNRLTRFWFDLSCSIRRSPASQLMKSRLNLLDGGENYAAVLWLTGGWHDRRRPMERLLWAIQCSAYVVTGASHLHAIAFEDDDSRTEGRKLPLKIG